MDGEKSKKCIVIIFCPFYMALLVFMCRATAPQMWGMKRLYRGARTWQLARHKTKGVGGNVGNIAPITPIGEVALSRAFSCTSPGIPSGNSLSFFPATPITQSKGISNWDVGIAKGISFISFFFPTVGSHFGSFCLAPHAFSPFYSLRWG